MKTIYKYPLKIDDFQDVHMPHDARVLSAGLDPNGQMCLWALVDPGFVDMTLEVRIAGTGHPLANMEGWRFVDTVLQGPFVWHVFVRGEA